MVTIALISASCALLALAAAGLAVAQVVPLRGRIEQLELERPRFLAELNGMFEACQESLDRAEAKRKRADNALRAAQGAPSGDSAPPGPNNGPAIGNPLRVVRGTFIEPL